MDCTECGEPDMIFYAGMVMTDEPDEYACPECAHYVLVER